MTHTHKHSHNNFNLAFGLGIVLNSIYVGVEVFYGLSINSSALVADAGHNFSDVFSLVLAWLAIWASKRKPTGKYTYGLRRSTILASMTNGLLIIAASAFILYDAIQKIQDPVQIPGDTIMIVAGIGLIINGGTALLFMKGQHDLNIKGAFLHMAADAGVTLGVLISGLIMKYTAAYWIDPAISFLIVIVILYSAWGLLSDSVSLAMDAVPKVINLEEVKGFLENCEKVEEVHDLHVWALSTTETAMTAHLVMPKGCDDSFLFKVREDLKKHFGINHCTIQIERTFEDDEYRD